MESSNSKYLPGSFLVALVKELLKITFVMYGLKVQFPKRSSPLNALVRI